jgi:hypothetical protein
MGAQARRGAVAAHTFLKIAVVGPPRPVLGNEHDVAARAEDAAFVATGPGTAAICINKRAGV